CYPSSLFFRWGNLRKAKSQELQSLPGLTGMGRNSCGEREAAALISVHCIRLASASGRDHDFRAKSGGIVLDGGDMFVCGLGRASKDRSSSGDRPGTPTPQLCAELSPRPEQRRTRL